MVYPEFFWIPKKLGVKNGGKSSPSENPNFLKIPDDSKSSMWKSVLDGLIRVEMRAKHQKLSDRLRVFRNYTAVRLL